MKNKNMCGWLQALYEGNPHMNITQYLTLTGSYGVSFVCSSDWNARDVSRALCIQIHYQCIQINKDQIYLHPITEWLTRQNLIQSIKNMPPLPHLQVKMAPKREKSTDRSPNLINAEDGHNIPWSFSGCTLTTFRMDYVTICWFSEFWRQFD